MVPANGPERKCDPVMAPMDRIYLGVICASLVVLTTAIGVASPRLDGGDQPGSFRCCCGRYRADPSATDAGARAGIWRSLAESNRSLHRERVAS